MLSEQWKKRILILAKKYGPFVRFYPGSTEEDIVVDDNLEPPAKTPEEQKQIDETRRNEQMLEQERANVVRAKETASRAQSELESTQSENATLKEQLAAAEAKALAQLALEHIKKRAAAVTAIAALGF